MQSCTCTYIPSVACLHLNHFVGYNSVCYILNVTLIHTNELIYTSIQELQQINGQAHSVPVTMLMYSFPSCPNYTVRTSSYKLVILHVLAMCAAKEKHKHS